MKKEVKREETENQIDSKQIKQKGYLNLNKSIKNISTFYIKYNLLYIFKHHTTFNTNFIIQYKHGTNRKNITHTPKKKKKNFLYSHLQ